MRSAVDLLKAAEKNIAAEASLLGSQIGQFQSLVSLEPVAENNVITKTKIFSYMAWEGKALLIESALNTIGAVFLFIDLAFSLAVEDPTQKKLDFIVNTIFQINSTVTDTPTSQGRAGKRRKDDLVAICRISQVEG